MFPIGTAVRFKSRHPGETFTVAGYDKLTSRYILRSRRSLPVFAAASQIVVSGE